MNEKKFKLEKVLHEIIRDLPEVKKINERYEKGFYTLDNALEEIAYILKQLRG